MLKDICAAVGRYTITACENTGRIMQLFLDTAARLKYANARETVRQMARLGADSLPIVLMTILFTGMGCFIRRRHCCHRAGARAGAGADGRCCGRAHRRCHCGGAWHDEGYGTD